MEFQQDQLTAYCQSQGWEIVHRYVDPGYTGKDGDRPALKRLLDDARYNTFEKVVVYKLDRLARNLRLLLEVEQKLRGHHASLTSVKESVDTSTGTGKMVFQMFGMIAEWERENIIERTRSGKLQRYRDGCWAGGKPPHGYSYDRDSRKLVVDEKEARVVRRIIGEYNSGRSLSAIADALNNDRVPPRLSKGKGWRANAVRHIVLNPVYKGTQVLNRHRPISEIAEVDMSKAIVVAVPPIVSEEEWRLAQQHLAANKRVRPVR